MVLASQTLSGRIIWIVASQQGIERRGEQREERGGRGIGGGEGQERR